MQRNLAQAYYNEAIKSYKTGSDMLSIGNGEMAKQHFNNAKLKFELVVKRCVTPESATMKKKAEDAIGQINQKLMEVTTIAQTKPKSKPIETDERKQDIVLVENPNVKWDDVIGLDGAKDALEEAVILPMSHPQLFDNLRKPWKGILLYGPPGTGKSFLAKATATAANNCSFISVTAAELESKWVGEGEKNVKALFETARQKKPAIIFIDEIESLLTSRESGNHNTSGVKIIDQFLVQMDGVGADNEGLLFLAATNHPWLLDDAVLSRFPKKIYIPLPDTHAREVMIGNLLKKTTSSITPIELKRIAEMTEGYSGRDISHLVQGASMIPLKRLRHGKFFKEIGGLIYVAKEGEEGAFEASFKDLPAEKIASPSLGFVDFIESLKKSKSTSDPSSIIRYDEWTEKMGEDATE